MIPERTQSVKTPDFGRYHMNKLLSRFGKDESGATAIEYALIAAIVGIGIITALINLKGQLNTTFETVESALSTANAE